MIKVFIVTFLTILILSAQAQTWLQRASFPNGGRYDGASFSIGNKGYIGLGNNTSLVLFNDFWEWDQASNSWSPIANFPGIARSGASSFSIEKKGYVICGYGSTSGTNEFWEWDGDVNSPTYNVWTRKADFPGTARVRLVTFSIGKKAYAGTGNYTKDFWEWDGDTASSSYNTWVQKADFGGGNRYAAIGFSIGLKGYIGTGTDGSNFRKDFWEWDGDTASPSYNTWVQKPNFPGGNRINAIGVANSNKAYVGLGLDSTGYINMQDFWEWNPQNNSWAQKINFAGTARQEAEAFAIDSTIYIGVGYDNGNAYDFWEYCNYCPPVGIQDLENGFSEFLIYPNPASDKIHLYNLPQDAELKMTLSNVSGQEVVIQKFNTSVLDVSNLSDGMYFLKIETKIGNTQTKKVIIRR